jgi:hypothetical protein
MTIHYDTTEEMLNIVAGLVMGGLTFKVIMSTKTIELTGGY